MTYKRWLKPVLFLLGIGLMLWAGYKLIFGPSISLNKGGTLRVFFPPTSINVFLDREKVGQSPRARKEIETEFYQIRLEDSEGRFASWENKVRVSPGQETWVGRTLSGQGYSFGSVISWREVNRDEEEIAFTSVPSEAEVSLREEFQGKTPVIFPVTPEKKEVLRLKLEGWQELYY